MKLNRTALQLAQDLAQLALAATGWRREVYWRAAMGEMRRARCAGLITWR